MFTMTREEKILLAIEKGYTCNPETGQIYTGRGKEVLSTNKAGYIQIQMQKDGKKICLFGHQFVYYTYFHTLPTCIDHINRIKNDNRISNLREATYQQNNWNRSNVKGYYIEKRNIKETWVAQIKLNNKTICLGSFETEADARDAYLNAKKIYHII
jgi:hypothetical protein